MGEKVLVVRSDELPGPLVGQRFKALPEEEILHHHGSVEVLALDRNLAAGDRSYRQLVACTTLHHNYRWLTHAHPSLEGTSSSAQQRSLIVSDVIRMGDRTPLFLDDLLAVAAARTVDRAVLIAGGYDLRLAGLIDGDGDEFGRAPLGLVYVAKLKQPGASARDSGISGISFCGNGDLRITRDRFEPWSQILIDHLEAL